MSSTKRTTLQRATDSYVLFVAVGVVIGVTLAPVAWDATASDGTVAVVPLDGSIDGGSATAVISMMQAAREDPDIKAVVIVSNSGGGGASASEELYLEAKRTAEVMPVVTSIDASAASGAYYTVVPSDYIFAKPASIVGSVGVLTTAPAAVEPNDIIATTGPNKLSGGDEREFYYLLDSMQEAFLNAVFEQRGDRIQLSRSEVASARIFSGSQAVENGMVDAIGGREDAVQKAAQLADLSRYEIRVLRPDAFTPRFVSRANFIASDAPSKEMVSVEYYLGTEGSAPVFLMMPASYVVEQPTEDRVRLAGEGVPPVRADATNRTEVTHGAS